MGIRRAVLLLVAFLGPALVSALVMVGVARSQGAWLGTEVVDRGRVAVSTCERDWFTLGLDWTCVGDGTWQSGKKGVVTFSAPDDRSHQQVEVVSIIEQQLRGRRSPDQVPAVLSADHPRDSGAWALARGLVPIGVLALTLLIWWWVEVGSRRRGGRAGGAPRRRG